MTWRIDGPQMNEAQKVLWELVRYTRGKGVDLGCGGSKAFHHFIGVDNLTDTKLFGTQMQPDVVCSVEDLSLFSDESMDFVFSSHCLEHIKDYKSTLKGWWRLLKDGGHLVLYLPHKDHYPQVGTPEQKAEWLNFAKQFANEEGKVPGSALTQFIEKRKESGITKIGELWAGTPAGNADHKHDFTPDDIIAAMREVGCWDLLENQVRTEDNEYSFFQVYKKRADGHKFTCDRPKPAKTACVIRYGAYGDLLQASSVFPGLKAQGYHVTLYTVPRGYEAVKHDPHIDDVVLQDTDQVPGAALGLFWEHLKKKYDKFVNLSESVEANLLILGNRSIGQWPTPLRHRMTNFNYIEVQQGIAEVPFKPFQTFYATSEEVAWAKSERAKMGKKVILWSLSGSSVHKSYPHMDQVIARLMVTRKDVEIVTVGDNLAQILEAGWENEPRVHMRSGVWAIRQSMAFIEEADLVFGPETGILNAAAFSKTPKVLLLSHSSRENLSRDWVNCTSLEPTETPCYPCHMMHYGFTFCAPGYMEIEGKKQRVGSLCSVNISPDRVMQAIAKWLEKGKG